MKKENIYNIKFDNLKGINENESKKVENIINKERKNIKGIIYTKSGCSNLIKSDGKIPNTASKFTFSLIGNKNEIGIYLKGIVVELNQLGHNYKLKNFENEKIIFSSKL